MFKQLLAPSSVSLNRAEDMHSSSPRAPMRAPKRAPIARDPESTHEELDIPVVRTHFMTYGDVTAFECIFHKDAKNNSVIPKELLSSAVILQISAKELMLIHSSIDRALHQSIYGNLVSQGYHVQIATAEPAVIAAIYDVASDSTINDSNRSSNKYRESAVEWITYAVENRATDIHIETRGNNGVVRIRVDGQMEYLRIAGGGIYPASHIVGAMSTLFNNDIQTKTASDSHFDPEKFLYGIIPFNEIPNKRINLRYQSFKGHKGPKVVLRILFDEADAPTLSFEQLGYASSQIDIWHRAMQNAYGAILIAGVTNSGKSTTQQSFIELHPKLEQMAIYTAEEPIEREIRGAHQIHVQRDHTTLDEGQSKYREINSAIVRGDLDMAMIQEIRDYTTSTTFQQIVQTGHIGLSTVHANSIAGIIPRLTNPEIGMNRHTLTDPNMLTLLVYQALVPVTCPRCSISTVEAIKTIPDAARLCANFEAIGASTERMKWRFYGHDNKCEACNRRGTVGQTVVAEMFMPTVDWLMAIREGDDHKALDIFASNSDLDVNSPAMDGKTVFEHAIYKSIIGTIDPFQCSQFEIWERYLNKKSTISKLIEQPANSQ
ncbi:GspE/PulE family protein [Variovorax ginsengisoli]|uniref:Type II secretory ATPase GspE/PulE/Tfp pilus assembly ATPase PilB-like protein n=1 Tax=Variovorax ginsengisoli TaxID=363844 RepID=A0ABT9SDX7_9BURK|nr:ATPase, T2SS/T4P/T4SS family [Variovorax ginsengisoli]MDP9902405.1 type II secretory ATPase GspE/PulE/Tfp pilus assembly ATPase PilB-like protein [Variovorax ginsengisoli]